MTHENDHIRSCRVPQKLSIPEPCKLTETGFNISTGYNYFYPLDVPIRKYQFKAVEKSLFKNILLCLPTGLGKTFVAAVTMLNYYRWYPNKKIFFIAPTRPLVNQQHQACLELGGIRSEETTLITGTLPPNKRINIYKEYKILFTTAQVLQNDITSGLCNPNDIILLVLDEAHKASGNHAYVQVIRSIQLSQNNFRILALTASPGVDTQAIQNVVDNLLINEIVYYHEDHEDVKEYIHSKKVSEIILTFEGPMKDLLTSFADKVDQLLAKLHANKALINPSIESWPSYRFKVAAVEPFKLKIKNYPQDQYKFLSQIFHICYFLITSYERLCYYGMLAFTRYLLAENGGAMLQQFALHYLKEDEQFFNKLTEIHKNMEISTKMSTVPSFPYHPKISSLINLLTCHFKSGSNKNGRVIVFSSFRDSVDEIVSALRANSTIIKVMPFVGQADSKHSKGLRQKDQLSSLEQFRNGEFNVLVSTSVGEEGLDIGDVNLIIFFDISSSALRLIQRMGRTGRKQSGSINILMIKGSEQNSYKNAVNKSKQMGRTLTKKISNINFSEPQQLFPPNFNPFCVFTRLKYHLSGNVTIKGLNKNSNKTEFSEFHVFDTVLNIPYFNSSSFTISGTFGMFHSIKSNACQLMMSHLPRMKLLRTISVDNIFKTNKTIDKQDPIHLFDVGLNISSDFDDLITYQGFTKCDNLETTQFTPIVAQQHYECEKMSDIVIVEESNKSEKHQTVMNVHKSHNESDIIVVSRKRRFGYDSSESESINFTKPNKNKFSLGRQMLLTQAEVADNDSSDANISDEEDDHYVHDSFINDESFNTSKGCSDALYKQSLISPFKNQVNASKRLNRWQQTVKNIERKIENNEYSSGHSEEACQSSTPQTKASIKDDIDIIFSSPATPLIFEKCYINTSIIDTIDVASSQSSIEKSNTNVYEKPVIFVNSKTISSSPVVSLLRHKYNVDLINFIDIPFDYMIGKDTVVDSIKANDLNDNLVIEKYVKKYENLKPLYEHIHIIIENEINIPTSHQSISTLHLFYQIFLPKVLSIRFSRSHENTAAFLFDYIIDLNKVEYLTKINASSTELCKIIKIVSQIANLNIISVWNSLILVQSAKTIQNLFSASISMLQQWCEDITLQQARDLVSAFNHII